MIQVPRARVQPEWAEMLLSYAAEASQRAYAPYSKFAVGAAVLAQSGTVYTGANVENASYGLSICAERVAMFSAAASGERKIIGLASVARPNDALTTCNPCGACRQVLAEFCDSADETIAVTLDENGQIIGYSLSELLPVAFNLAEYEASKL